MCVFKIKEWQFSEKKKIAQKIKTDKPFLRLRKKREN